ncbi:DsbA family oxidoreductase [Maribacter algarum]|uniref:DsbA family oxidoreductase n=1 Tax=Maribacter algarum (ex Zhang et al. 2020) TaxID=2578118 RepID=A0A5S3PZN4_9FLAO|nr:DsbA family oxidoreductase [Maribacter algarum]TMM58787.1 DsbA family oxidoreductase [Maribacter algarum]
MQKHPIKVAVVSDVACPWCYVGKRRLESALQQWQGAPVEVTWHPFQLDPTIPEAGYDRETYLANKFGDRDLTDAMKRITDAGEGEGITFNFGDKWLAVNTLPLHQLLHVAGDEGFKDQLKERFLKAYFDENLHLNDTEVLIKVMQEFDWAAEKTTRILNDDAIAYAVKQEIAHYQQLGVTGVPFFIINDQYGISGAQPVEVFLEAFGRVSEMQVIGESDGDSCGVDGVDC